MDEIIYLLLAICSIPFILLIVGIIMLFNKNEAVKKNGKTTLMTGVIIIGIGILIGTVLCSSK